MKSDNIFTGVQALRFIAAMLVVYTHATGMVAERLLGFTTDGSWQPGQSGVDLFFVISGFVMATSSRNLIGRIDACKIFLTRRIIRIVPLYWIATTLKVALLLAIPALPRNTPIDFQHVVSSYLFLPTFDENSHLSFPVMQVGWTLNYEMLFYALFAFALFIKQPVLKFTATLFVILSFIHSIAGPSFAYAYGFLDPILLEFVMGMAVAEICRRGFTLNPWVGLIAVVISFAIMFNSGDLPIGWRWAFWGLPAMVIVGVVTLLESTLRGYIPKLITTLGDASYSIYLFHTFVIPVLGIIFVKLNLASPVVALTISMILSPLVGLIIYKLLELPMTRWFKQRTSPPTKGPTISPNLGGV